MVTQKEYTTTQALIEIDWAKCTRQHDSHDIPKVVQPNGQGWHLFEVKPTLLGQSQATANYRMIYTWTWIRDVPEAKPPGDVINADLFLNTRHALGRTYWPRTFYVTRDLLDFLEFQLHLIDAYQHLQMRTLFGVPIEVRDSIHVGATIKECLIYSYARHDERKAQKVADAFEKVVTPELDFYALLAQAFGCTRSEAKARWCVVFPSGKLPLDPLWIGDKGTIPFKGTANEVMAGMGGESPNVPAVHHIEVIASLMNRITHAVDTGEPIKAIELCGHLSNRLVKLFQSARRA